MSVDMAWWGTVLTGATGFLNTEDSSAGDEQYTVLPRPGDPRILVDHGSPRAMSDAIERMVSSRTSNQMLRGVAARSSSLALKRSADWGVSGDGDLGTLRQHLSSILDADVKLSIAVGPPRPNRKPVVRCYDGDEVVAVAKLGPDPHTKLMVENEATWLASLQCEPLDGVVTPALLHSGTYGSSALLMMAPLDLVDDLGVGVAEMPMGVLEQFVGRYIDGDSSVADTPWWRTLPTRLGDAQAELFREHAAVLADEPNFSELAVSAWHGDWSPWNTGRTRSGELAIWDWERTTIGAPTGFDVLHLHYQYGAGFDGATLGLASLGVLTAHHRLLRRLYLLELCARHAEGKALDTPRHAEVLAEFGRLS